MRIIIFLKIFNTSLRKIFHLILCTINFSIIFAQNLYLSTMVAPILPATVNDADFLAQAVFSALGIADYETNPSRELQQKLNHLPQICRRSDTLYSYKNARIAFVNGKYAGALIAYDGKDYEKLRLTTFTLLKEEQGIDLLNNAMETTTGEFYLDTLSISPKFRGHELGKQLILDRISIEKMNGHALFTLLVDAGHPKIQAYYSAIGFVPYEKIMAFGCDFVKMKYVVG